MARFNGAITNIAVRQPAPPLSTASSQRQQRVVDLGARAQDVAPGRVAAGCWSAPPPRREQAGTAAARGAAGRRAHRREQCALERRAWRRERTPARRSQAPSLPSRSSLANASAGPAGRASNPIASSRSSARQQQQHGAARPRGAAAGAVVPAAARCGRRRGGGPLARGGGAHAQPVGGPPGARLWAHPGADLHSVLAVCTTGTRSPARMRFRLRLRSLLPLNLTSCLRPAASGLQPSVQASRFSRPRNRPPRARRRAPACLRSTSRPATHASPARRRRPRCASSPHTRVSSCLSLLSSSLTPIAPHAFPTPAAPWLSLRP